MSFFSGGGEVLVIVGGKGRVGGCRDRRSIIRKLAPFEFRRLKN